MRKSVLAWAEAMDVHHSLEETLKKKLREKRRSERKRAEEYAKELEAMKTRVAAQPYLFERVTQEQARKEAERRYRAALRRVGLSEDFVKRTGRGAGPPDTWRTPRRRRDDGNLGYLHRPPFPPHPSVLLTERLPCARHWTKRSLPATS
ncbi:protein FAM161B [Tachyglossus aculeatus]|uniref:protein FAM161B n=1 Tax=Tachyglossus aculeatus TaxID=9261 RepID=UPI0018F7A7A3|nr:protein FAM161B [Tachyglossus aculeatus]